ncbi:male sterility protein-domain-containing protein [Schizophyllum commune]
MQKRPGYATNDLFVAHPTKPHLRRVVGRRDDVIVHSTGEKTVPAPIEGVVLTSPLVAAAVMFGRGRDEAGILIELAPAHQVDVDDDTAVAAYRNAVWPVIEEANRVAPAYSRIFKELILTTRMGKPLPRTEKNTVMRKLALEVYNTDIEKIYAVVESHAQTGEKGVKPPSSWDVAAVAVWLAEHGFDSLNATVLRLRLLGALKSDPSASSAALRIAQNVVYDYPSIEKLAALVSKLVGGEEHHAEAFEALAKEAIVAMAAKYSEGLPGYAGAATLPQYVAPTDPNPLSMPVSVLVTGTTGNLGAELLAIVLKDERVERVYTLDREALVSVRDRQRARFADKGLDLELLESEKLVALAGDAYANRLGQSEALYDEMLSRANVVIHAAWRLDFNLNLSAFERSIQGTRALVDFARETRHPDSFRFLFTSSIASTRSWDATQRPVPEDIIDDIGVSVLGGGYGQSK